jgi:Cytochrome c7 and related cytochrome c/Class III cytochrome C family
LRENILYKVAASVAAALAFAMVLAMFGLYPREAAPIQPIAFSHKLHAGDYEIDCFYCHVNARRSIVAGVPSMQLCMGCHKNVGKEKPEVQKLSRLWEQRRPVEWIKVNDLPDFVYFSHKRHVAAEVACETCHGQVEKMERVSQGRVLSMEKCVSCHLERKASIDCWTCHK